MQGSHKALRARGWLTTVAAFVSASAAGTGLQVSPTSLNISATHSAAVIWLSDTGDTALRAQGARISLDTGKTASMHWRHRKGW